MLHTSREEGGWVEKREGKGEGEAAKAVPPWHGNDDEGVEQWIHLTLLFRRSMVRQCSKLRDSSYRPKC